MIDRQDNVTKSHTCYFDTTYCYHRAIDNLVDVTIGTPSSGENENVRTYVGDQSGKALLSTSFWRSDDRSNEFQTVSDDRSSETVWRGDDRSSDRHFFPLIDHRKQFGGHKSDHLPVKPACRS